MTCLEDTGLFDKLESVFCRFRNSTVLLTSPSSLLLRGNTKETRGTAFVVYEDIYDAKNACDNLSGFHVLDRSCCQLTKSEERFRYVFERKLDAFKNAR